MEFRPIGRCSQPSDTRFPTNSATNEDDCTDHRRGLQVLGSEVLGITVSRPRLQRRVRDDAQPRRTCDGGIPDCVLVAMRIRGRALWPATASPWDGAERALTK